MGGSAAGMGGGVPMAPQGNFNVNQAAAGGLQQAMAGTQMAAGAPNVAQFANPYTQMVTGQALGDLERQRQTAINQTGAEASRARAFGGSRHGVAEGATNAGFASEGARMFGNLQQQGFNTALGAAQNQQRTQLGAAGQMGQLGQQAFNTGQSIQQQQMQQGMMQQAMQQQLIDAARQQYQGYTGAPQAALSAPLQALGQTPVPHSQTTTSKPGLFDYLGAGMGMFGLG
jgi:hypothetical protein